MLARSVDNLVIANLRMSVTKPLSLIVVTHAELALAAKAVGPEAFKRWRTMELLERAHTTDMGELT